MSNMSNQIHVKSLTGDLYELSIDNNNLDHIATQLCLAYPNDFSPQTKIIKCDDVFCALSEIYDPSKNISFKKKIVKENSICLYIGLNLFECIRAENVKFYEEGHEVFPDIDELKKIYTKHYRGTSILGPKRLGVDSNRLNIIRYNDDYACSMGNHGSIVRGKDLKLVLFELYKQGICCPNGFPFYSIHFQFKPEVIDYIVSMAPDWLKI